MYPEPNAPGTNNGLQNNLNVPRFPKAVRDNYDGKINWNRSSSHQFWGKFSMMRRRRHGPVLLPIHGSGRREDGCFAVDDRPDLDAQSDARVRRERRFEQDDPQFAGPGLWHQLWA